MVGLSNLEGNLGLGHQLVTGTMGGFHAQNQNPLPNLIYSILV